MHIALESKAHLAKTYQNGYFFQATRRALDKVEEVRYRSLQEGRNGRRRLKAFAGENTSPGFSVEAIRGEFVKQLSNIDRLIGGNCRTSRFAGNDNIISQRYDAI
jgi:hypothetical protein